MDSRQPTVSVTADGLVIRIPWRVVDVESTDKSGRKRQLSIDDVLEFVEAGRLAHRLGLARTVKSLKELRA